MTDRRSVVVVGAGIIGCAIARELGARGVACTVVDERGVAAGATHASAGMLAPYVEAHEAGPLLDLAVRSLHLYPAWIDAVAAETGIAVEFRRIGTLEVAATADGAAALRQASSAHGQWLDAARLRTDFPVVGAALGGRVSPEHGYVVPPQLTAALAAAARGYGVQFHAARVDRVTAGGAWQVRTSDGALTADAVIVAAGAWAGGIEGVHMPPVRPVRGQIVELAWRAPELATIVWGPDCYVVPRLDRTVLVGATVEEAGYDERTTAAGVAGLLDGVRELLPEARDASFLGARAGLRPATPDGLPVIDGDPEAPGIFFALGHYRNGVLLAPITAALIADLVVDGRRGASLIPFGVERFR